MLRRNVCAVPNNTPTADSGAVPRNRQVKRRLKGLAGQAVYRRSRLMADSAGPTCSERLKKPDYAGLTAPALRNIEATAWVQQQPIGSSVPQVVLGEPREEILRAHSLLGERIAAGSAPAVCRFSEIRHASLMTHRALCAGQRWAQCAVTGASRPQTMHQEDAAVRSSRRPHCTGVTRNRIRRPPVLKIQSQVTSVGTGAGQESREKPMVTSVLLGVPSAVRDQRAESRSQV